MIFRRGGRLRNCSFKYIDQELEIVNKFSYLGVTFSPGGSLSLARNTLAGQAQKATFQLEKYLYKLTFISPKHKLELFDRLILPILNYCAEICGFSNDQCIERIHLQFCKRLLGVKRQLKMILYTAN